MFWMVSDRSFLNWVCVLGAFCPSLNIFGMCGQHLRDATRGVWRHFSPLLKIIGWLQHEKTVDISFLPMSANTKKKIKKNQFSGNSTFWETEKVTPQDAHGPYKLSVIAIDNRVLQDQGGEVREQTFFYRRSFRHRLTLSPTHLLAPFSFFFLPFTSFPL